MATAKTDRVSGCILWLLFVTFSSSFSTISANEVSLVKARHITLQLSSGLQVENDPGYKSGMLIACERVHIHGLSRIKHMWKFAHSVKVMVKVPQTGPRIRPQNIEVCIHRNESLSIGMCPQHQWEKLVKGYWIHLMSPYDHKLLDIRAPGPSLDMIEVSIEEEFLLYRAIFLVLGIIMMMLGPFLSKCVGLYYGSAMAVGVILVILMVLFQGMKLLPTGRKSSLAILVYSSIVGVGSFLLRYTVGLFHSVLVDLGISEDMYKPLGIFLLVCFVLAGAWLGFWIVRKFILTEEGSVDKDVAYFVACSIRIFAAVMILQCSLDSILAVGALLSVILISSTMRRVLKRRFFRRLYKRLFRTSKSDHGRSNVHDSPFGDSHDEYLHKMQRQEEKFQLLRPQTRPFTLASCNSPVTGLSKTPSYQPSDSETYYSTFHNTPERKNFSKDEWERFTRESTKGALEALVSSPEFNKWAVANAERITLTPTEDQSGTFKRNRRWFLWF